MKNNLEYKGYHTKIDFSPEDMVLYGKIEGINDLVTFESESAQEIEKEFHNAVDDYLDYCKEVGKNPDKSYKGTFNVRINPDLHRQISEIASKKGISMNQAIEDAIRMYTNTDDKVLESKISEISNILDYFKTSGQINILEPNCTYLTSVFPTEAFELKGV